MLQRMALAGTAPPRGWLAGARLPMPKRRAGSAAGGAAGATSPLPAVLLGRARVPLGVRAQSAAAAGGAGAGSGGNGTAKSAAAAGAAAVEAATATATTATATTTTAPAAQRDADAPATLSSRAYLTRRHQDVLRHFPTALGVDDFIARVEVALCGYGFTGENSIAMTNLCRDEVTTMLKDKIEAVFGSSFNTNGLGAVLTCGVTGIRAGLSHSPVATDDGRERYVFFSFPHIAIDDAGNLGAIYRPNRPGTSCACGALAKALSELQGEGLSRNVKIPGVHDPLDPEYTILKQRLARRVQYESQDPRRMDLAGLTSLAERVITDDLEYLIEKCVDPQRADFALVAGVQIHNWSRGCVEEANLEFVAPTKVYVVVEGEVTMLDLLQLPSLTPRQINLLAQQTLLGAGGAAAAAPAPMALGGAGAAAGDPSLLPGMREESGVSMAGPVTSTLQSIPASYLMRRMAGASCAHDGDPVVHRAPPTRPRNAKPAAATSFVQQSQQSPAAAAEAASQQRDREKAAADEESRAVSLERALHQAGSRAHALRPVAQGPVCAWPGWQTGCVARRRRRRSRMAPTMDGEDDGATPRTSFTTRHITGIDEQ